MRQHRATHDIANRPNAVYAGCAVVVDFDKPALTRLQSTIVRQQTVDKRTPPDADDDAIEFFIDRLAIRILVRQGHGITPHCTAGHFAAEADIQPLPGENLLRLAGNLLVHRRQEVRQRFNDNHVAAQPPPDTAQLEADDAGADDAQALRYLVKFQRAGGVDDHLVVDAGRRNVDRH